MKQKSELSSAAKRQGQDLRRRRLTKSNSKENNKQKAKRPELEEKLAEWITEQRDKHRYIIDYRAYCVHDSATFQGGDCNLCCNMTN